MAFFWGTGKAILNQNHKHENLQGSQDPELLHMQPRIWNKVKEEGN